MKNSLEEEKALTSFQNLIKQCHKVNTGRPKFENSMAAASHYKKHAYLPKVHSSHNLTPEEYFRIATEMCSGPIINPKWTQDGSSLFIHFFSEKYRACAIRYDNLANKTSTIATLMANTKTKTPMGRPKFYHTHELRK